MKKKRGQFYLVAILLIISLIIGITTVKNSINVNKRGYINSVEDDLNFEKSQVLEYIAKEDLNEEQSMITLGNFSNEYVDFIGKDKNVFFIYGSPSSITFLGNRVSNETIEYNFGGENVTLESEGYFGTSVSPSSSEFIIYFGEETYVFELKPGQNIYYLIKYNYGNEVYIVYG